MVPAIHVTCDDTKRDETVTRQREGCESLSSEMCGRRAVAGCSLGSGSVAKCRCVTRAKSISGWPGGGRGGQNGWKKKKQRVGVRDDARGTRPTLHTCTCHIDEVTLTHRVLRRRRLNSEREERNRRRRRQHPDHLFICPGVLFSSQTPQSQDSLLVVYARVVKRVDPLSSKARWTTVESILTRAVSR